MEQISLLKAHVIQGCLSHVEPGGGTNYNEALHCYINPHFNHAGRIGIPLAFAFLTILFYKYNCKKMPPCSISVPLTAKEDLHITTSFGIIVKDDGGLKDKWLAGSKTIELSEDECDNEELYLACDALEDVFLIPIIDMESIIKTAVNLTEIAKNVIKKSGKSPTFYYQMMSFMCDVPSMFFHQLDNDTNENKIKHEQRLNNVLNAWGMHKISIDGDGNCCFNAIAFSIFNNYESFGDDYKLYLEALGLNIKANSMQEISFKLRELTVTGWLENSSTYQEFLPEITIHEEATKFLTLGYYHGDLADTIILIF